MVRWSSEPRKDLASDRKIPEETLAFANHLIMYHS